MSKQAIASQAEGRAVPAGVRKRRAPGGSETLAGLLFVSPMLLGVFILVLMPILATLVLSFADWNFVQGWDGIDWVGFGNFEKLLHDGAVRAIGVSNFQPTHLQRLAEETETVPAINQVELHPYLTQAAVREYDATHGIATESWSPLAKGGALLRDQVVTSLAEKYGRTPAQIVLRWHLQLGLVVIPKSVTPARIESAPRLAPTERSSTMVSFAGSDPARSRMARSFALCTVKLPLIWPEPPRIGCRMTGAEITTLSRMMANGRPTFLVVTWPNFCAPPPVRRKFTTGSLVCWSKPACASARSSPVISAPSSTS